MDLETLDRDTIRQIFILLVTQYKKKLLQLHFYKTGLSMTE